jgi:hypothetical protein
MHDFSNEVLCEVETNIAWIATISPEAAVMPQTQLAQAPFPLDRHGALGSTQLQARLYDR